MSPLRSEQGFTLIEVLVATALSIVIFGSVLNVLDVFQRDNGNNTLRNEAQDNARNALDALSRELRNGAAPSSLTPGALEKAEEYSIVFQTIEPTTKALGVKDLNTTNAIRVRYCLRKEILYKQTAKWETKAAPELPASREECPDLTDYSTSVQVAQHIVNKRGGKTRTPLFAYLGGRNVSEITGVEPDVIVNVNPGKPFPGETQLKTAIDLRNENRPPLASFTAKEVGTGVVELNGTQSTDPDGLALTYAWYDNGTELTSHSSLTDINETVGTEHKFKLVVTTPSGLESTAESPIPLKI